MTQSAAKPRLHALVPSLGVSDLRRSIAFYREFFGLEPVDTAEDAQGSPLWVWLRCGKAELMLQQLDADAQITLEPALGHSWVLYLRPADLGRTRDRLAAAGVEVSPLTVTPYGARECFARDPDGYSLWLSTPSAGGGSHQGEEEEDEEEEDEFEYGDSDTPEAPDAGTLDEPDEDAVDDPDEGVIDETEDDDFDDPDEGIRDKPGGGGHGPGPDDRIH